MTARPRARHRAEDPAGVRRRRPARPRRTGRTLRAPLLLTLVLTVSSLALTTPSDAVEDAGTAVPVPAGTGTGTGTTAGG